MMTLPKTRKEQEIWQACDDLLAVGKTIREITGEAIAVRLRELKYKAGSSNERYKYRDSWMAARGLSREEQGRGVADISDPIARAATVFRDGLERELRLEYEKKYQQLETTLAEKEEIIERKERQLQEVKNQLTESIQAHEKLQARYQLQSENWQTLNEESISQKTLIHQLQQQASNEKVLYQTQLEQLQQWAEGQKKITEQQTAHLEKTYQAHVSDIKEASETQRHRLIVELDAAKMEVKRFQQEQQKGQDAYLALQQQYSELQGQHQQLRAESVTFRTEQEIYRVNDSAIIQKQFQLFEELVQRQTKVEATLLPITGLPRILQNLQKKTGMLTDGGGSDK
ncbi:MAG: hypothetical protein K2Q14_00145 [Gammaproteobacteria bacterium]|nr:hypothetical protein [Gammaproteobacteria bacterium]